MNFYVFVLRYIWDYHKIYGGGGGILIEKGTPIDDPEWQTAFRQAMEDLPYMLFLQDTSMLSGYGASTLFQFAPNLPQEAQEWAKIYEPPDFIWDAILKVTGDHTPKPKRTQNKKKEIPGYVYLLRSNTGYYKIGRTKDPDNRLKVFGVKLPFEVGFAALIQSSDMVQMEKDLHELYEAKRVNGEWFDLSPEDVEYIKGLQS